MELIQTISLGSDVAGIEFTNIPQKYKHLYVYASLKGSGGGDWYDYRTVINGSVSNLSNRFMYATNNGGPTSQADATDMILRYPTNVWSSPNHGTSTILISNYSSTSQHKGIWMEGASMLGGGSGQNIVNISGGKWANTSAITTLKLVDIANNSFKAYSMASLYGMY
jgi:hypothetical protein